jgi:putative drug exporter of the RND superfamily
VNAPLSNLKGVKTRIARASRITRGIFTGHHDGATVLKWEAVPKQSPFSRESLATLEEIERVAEEFLKNTDSSLRGARLDVGGVTAAMRDLETVTKSDYRTTRWLVTLCVFGSVLAALRRPVVSFYIVATTLFGFFVTMGLTYWTFALANVDVGYMLEWRVPLFLFVILVAVGSDYSLFLASRVLEEQSVHGPFTGLRRGIEQTGGVISSCGIIMAGTFISMTAGVWASAFPENWSWPAELFGSPQDVQRGIVELGFALALGILLDTFVVRTILLPAFLACLAHWKAFRELKRQKADVV